MSDALGGLVNLGLVIFFIIMISLYMAFNINYQKAFNAKNEIIAIYQRYGGECDSDCREEIEAYESKIGYGKIQLQAISGTNEHCSTSLGYCVTGVEAKKEAMNNDEYGTVMKYCYFDIRTQVLIEIPIINNLMHLRLFQVTGQTKSLKKVDTRDCDAIAAAGIVDKTSNQ